MNNSDDRFEQRKNIGKFITYLNSFFLNYKSQVVE